MRTKEVHIDAYEVTCSECGHEMRTQPSLFMDMGFNHGSITCTHCLAHLHTEIIAPGQMTSRPYAEFVEAAKRRTMRNAMRRDREAEG